jgi:hypothetical protein
MLEITIDIIRSGLKSDASLTPYDRTRLLALIRNWSKVPKSEKHLPEPRLIRRIEAARRIGCSPRTIDRLGVTGVLRKRKLPGRVRAVGFLESDVAAFITAEAPQVNAPV